MSETLEDDKSTGISDQGITEESRGIKAGSRLTRGDEPSKKVKSKDSKKEEPTDDKKEFNVLKSQCKKKEGTFSNADDYIKYRNNYFGSEATYIKASTKSDKEFEKLKKKGKVVYIGQTESDEFKKYLFRWTRYAYKKRVPKGDVANLVENKMTKEMKKKINEVKKVQSFKEQGFLFRPQKSQRKYILGTISKHALGTAVDIRPDENPQLTKKEWDFVLEFTGKKIDKTKAQWKKDPAAFWQDIHDLNATFVKKLKEMEEKHKKSLEKKDKSAKDDLAPDHNMILKDYHNLLISVTKNGIDHGFFSLEKKLVVALAKQELIWGVTFPETDLHHFEMS